MIFAKDAPKARRFRICIICILIVILLAFIVFVAHLANHPSRPFVSVSFARTNLDSGRLPAISIELSNTMLFSAKYWITAIGFGNRIIEVSSSFSRSSFAGYNDNSLTAHSQRRELLLQPLEGTTLYVSYVRQLTPLENSVLNKLPWLRRHYPFRPRLSSLIYEVPKTEQTSDAFLNDMGKDGWIFIEKEPGAKR